MSLSKLRKFLPVTVALWIVCLVAGFYWLSVYESTPGQAAVTPTSWPSDTSITRDAGLPTLVMFVHPHCPCSRASIAELATIMNQVQGQVDAHVLFIRPKEFGVDWEKTDTWYSAKAITGVKLSVDVDGQESMKFGSRISGQTFLFDSTGNPIFNGGITGSRGHIGNNAGRQAVLSLIQQHTSDDTNTAVFGCDLTSTLKPEDCDAPKK